MTTSQVITITISFVAALVALLSFVSSNKRADASSAEGDGIDKGMIMTQLSAIRETLAEIKEEIRESRSERRELRDIVMTLEQKVKALEKAVFAGKEN